MTPSTIATVQSTWPAVAAIAPQAAALFYQNLFEADPKLKPLFKGDMAEQGNKLMQMLGLAVKGLSDVESLLPALHQLGEKHVDYGVKPEHYDTVGAALLKTLEQGLGDAFTPEVKTAWAEVYGAVATEMKAAAYA
ncbi:globin family protein [Hydrogenophaga sp. 5NK40-0174]|uniref:globin family protein n=1 Tax=Hydrogenophaga sp. 5NK40-0174 TaxID=3127649 RepID=UPI003106C8A8